MSCEETHGESRKGGKHFKVDDYLGGKRRLTMSSPPNMVLL
jgi:hypothetical protein